MVRDYPPVVTVPMSGRTECGSNRRRLFVLELKLHSYLTSMASDAGLPGDADQRWRV